jgi:hypothetical protein
MVVSPIVGRLGLVSRIRGNLDPEKHPRLRDPLVALSTGINDSLYSEAVGALVGVIGLLFFAGFLAMTILERKKIKKAASVLPTPPLR